MKECKTCKETKSLNDFYKAGYPNKCLMTSCKTCFNKSNAKANVQRWKERKQKLVEMFGGKCEICGGEFHPSVFDFHHTDPSTKSFGISGSRLSAKWDTILNEAKKCIMICANCHRTLHNTEEP